MTTWHNICISDKNGQKLFKNNCSEMSLGGQIRELQRHLEGIKNWHESYTGLDIDVETAFVMVDGVRLQTMDEIFDELEKELMS